MTAWTALIILVGVCAKCALDMIGLEYQAKYQTMTDSQFMMFFKACVSFAVFVDGSNLIRYFGRRK